MFFSNFPTPYERDYVIMSYLAKAVNLLHQQAILVHLFKSLDHENPTSIRSKRNVTSHHYNADNATKQLRSKTVNVFCVHIWR